MLLTVVGWIGCSGGERDMEAYVRTNVGRSRVKAGVEAEVLV
jgi:hypothetical protein